jgi:hypothetical protein
LDTPQAGAIWPQAYIDNRLDAMLLQSVEKVLWLPTAIANRIDLGTHHA